MTFTPSYFGCTLGGLEEAINVNGSRYTLTSTAAANVANADITSCTTPLEIVQGTCVIKIGNQPNTPGELKDIEFEDIAGTNPSHSEFNVTVSMIEWSGTAGCPATIVNVFGDNAELIGTKTVQAYVDNGGTAEGGQVKLEAT